MTTPRSTRITVPVVASNGGEYQISYERPGPVDQAAVESDLVDLGRSLTDRETEVGEAHEIVRRPAGPATVAGETTTNVRLGDRSVIVNVCDEDAIADYFDGTADEQVRVMVLIPGPDGNDTAVFMSVYESGRIVLSHDGDVVVSD